MKFSKLTRQREIGVRAVRFANGSMDADLSDPQYDSRRIKQGSVFFAIQGFTSDGHDYIAQAIERGAETIVCERPFASEKEVNVIEVEDVRKALAIISEEAFGEPSTKLRLIGVTGTNGKTTTTNLIKQLLEANGERVGMIGTLGVYIGKQYIATAHTTPESRDLSELMAEMISKNITTCVMEVSSHAIELSRVLALDFDIGIFTNLTQDHLDFHHTMKEYAESKQKFFSSLKETAVAITNADDEYGMMMTEHSHANIHSYGKHDGSKFGSADIHASDIKMSLRGMSFSVKKRYSDEEARLSCKLVGEFNVENVLAAVSALYFGVEGCSLARLSELVAALDPVRGRFEQIELAGGALAIVDYAHTPDALENVLATIAKLRTSGKIITVFGCGGDRDRAKRPLMGAIAERMSDVVIVTSDNPRTEDPDAIIAEIQSGMQKKNVTVEPDRKKAIEKAVALLGAHDILLVAGKGHEDYQIIGKEKIHFDDKEIILSLV